MKKNLFFCQKGVLTVQFLFGFIIVSGFMVVFALLTLTLVVSEITQYITFSASRSLFLSHVDPETQIERAKKKYKSLSTDFRFFSSPDGNAQNKWFDIKEDILPGDGLGLNESHFVPDPPETNLFYGVWTHFQARVLDMDMLFLGKTTEQTGDDAFRVKSIGSYLGREPSQKECEDFTKERWNEISKAHGFNTQSIRPDGGANPDENYRSHKEPDNGC